MAKKYIIPLFFLIILVQLVVPAKMIFDQEQLIKYGKEFKFRTAPVDPNDPFRGKYIALNFKENTIDVAHYEKWEKGEDVYACIEEDENGFAKLNYVSHQKPEHKHYILSTIQNVKTSMDENNITTNVEIRIQYPFNRYYMEESKAKAAEDLYRKSTADQKTLTYALVNVKEGKATLKDVIIDNKSIKDIVEESNNN